MWIRAEIKNPACSYTTIVDSSLLYYITTSKYFNFEVHLIGKSLFYRLVPDKNLIGI